METRNGVAGQKPIRLQQLSLDLTPQAHAILEELVETGLSGLTKADVAEQMLYRALQQYTEKPVFHISPDGRVSRLTPVLIETSKTSS